MQEENKLTVDDFVMIVYLEIICVCIDDLSMSDRLKLSSRFYGLRALTRSAFAEDGVNRVMQLNIIEVMKFQDNSLRTRLYEHHNLDSPPKDSITITKKKEENKKSK